jgi:hypothetical protein
MPLRFLIKASLAPGGLQYIGSSLEHDEQITLTVDESFGHGYDLRFLEHVSLFEL